MCALENFSALTVKQQYSISTQNAKKQCLLKDRLTYTGNSVFHATGEEKVRDKAVT